MFYNIAKGGMEIMNICIIEDNKMEANFVSSMSIDVCKELKITEPSIYCFNSPDKFTDWIKCNKKIHVCFLDIDLQSEDNGIALAKIIKEKDHNTLIVFMTSYDNYFQDMVQVEPFRFLPKPFQYNEFYKIFVDIYKRIILKNSEKDCTYKFKNNGIIYSANLKEVIYMTSYKRKIIIMDVRDQHMEFYGKLDDVEIEVNSLTDKFIRINKSYLFNQNYIEYIGKNSISVQGLTYQISPKYRQKLKIIT